MYYITLSFLLLFSIIEMFSDWKKNLRFNICYILMTYMMTFKFGQMDDYFNYYLFYITPGSYLETDIGYELIMDVFRYYNVSYIRFMGIISFLCMALSYRFFNNICNKSCISLLVFYSYTYLTCMMTNVRQGLCLALLLFMYPYIKEKKWVIFFIGVAIGTSIHLSFVITIFIPFVMNMKLFNKPIILHILLAVTILAIVGASLSKVLHIDRMEDYEQAQGGQGILMRLALRIILIIPVLIYKPNFQTDGYYAKALCISGYILSCLFCTNELTSSRLEWYYRTFLCLFVSTYLLQKIKQAHVNIMAMFLIIAIHTFLWFRNIQVEIIRCDYKPSVTILNFPFISVFDKLEIDKYRIVNTFGLKVED